MQDHPGAPGTARQGPTRIIMLVNSGGVATQPRAPGHERPCAALRAARHGRLSAASTAPGADVPPATTAGAPGQYCLSAAPRAPGHGRPAAAQRAAGHDRLSAALQAPDAGARLAVTATPPSHHRPSATLAIATAPLPAHVRRLLQVVLPRVPATPRPLIYPHSHRNPASRRSVPTPPLHMVERGPGDGPRAHHTWHYPCGFGPSGGEAHSTTHQVHPATQVPPRPQTCSVAGAGSPRQHPSRAPPASASRRPPPQRADHREAIIPPAAPSQSPPCGR